MKSRYRAHEASKFAPEDFISNMPDIVITNILDRLTLQDAVGTSVLSRNWRSKWTILSQLVFDEKLYDFLETKHEENYEKIISRLLLHLQGPITKFALCINEGIKDEDMAHWILFLSRKGVKELSMWKNDEKQFDVPTHIFSCLELKHLSLYECRFNPPSSFHGFPNLLSLELFLVEFEIGKFGELFTHCPVLEILDLVFTDIDGKVKLSEIKKLTNLKILNLCLGYLDTTEITSSSSSIFELLGFLPKLQELDLDFRNFKFTEDGSRKRSLTTFSCLKKLKLSFIDLCSEIMLPFAFDIIKSFPNLQTLEITADARYNDPPPAICSSKVDFNTMGLLQLRSVVFTNLKDSTNEVCLVEYVLACSPFLKKVVIRPHSTLMDKAMLKFAKKLLELHRASPVAKIKLE